MRWIVWVALVMFFALALGHGAEEESASLAWHLQPVNWLVVSFAIVLLVVAYSIVRQDAMGEKGKKAAFALIVASVIISTAYLAGTTVWENVSSVTGGPVHWHADFEVWACGEKLQLKESEGFEGKVGTNLFHHHNDLRIHVEGTVRDLQDVSLGNFFRSISGDLHDDHVAVILHDGTRLDKNNGDLCPDGRPGTLQLYVNGKREEHIDDYVIAPYSTVPPGDYLHVVFDSKEGVPNGG